MSMRLRALMRWQVIVPVLIGFAALIILLFFLLRPQSTSEQPIAFDHEIMVQMGITCLYCHNEARLSPAAGMPSVQKCMGCHKVVDSLVPVIQQVAGYWDRQEPIPWVRVNQMARFVFFSHEVHVNGGQNCENCHGDVGHMQIARPVVRMNMGWCVNCHQKQPDSARLVDCLICHR